MAVPELSEGRCYICDAITQNGAQLCVLHYEEAEQFTAHLKRKKRYEEIRVSALSVDQRFQRPMNDLLVKDIVHNFNELALGTPIVSRRAHEHTILDGQQRWTALLRMGFAEVTCEVYEGLTFEQEVLVFVILNDKRRSVRRGVLFNDKALAGVPLYRDAMTILQGFGYKVLDPGSASAVKVNQLSCPTTIEEVHRMGKLAATLYVMTNAWPGSAEPNRREMLLGIAGFLHVNPHITKEELAQALGRFSPTELVDMARAQASTSVERRKWVHMYAQVVDHYNYKRGREAGHRVAKVDIPPSAPRSWYLG